MAEYRLAEQHYRQAILLNQNSAGAHTGLGDALSGQGKLDEAIDEYLLAISIKDDDAQPHNGLGYVYFHKGQMDKAEDEYRKATHIKEDSHEAHDGLGSALARMGRLDEAIDEHRAAIKIKQDYAPAHLNLGFALMGKGLLGEAIKEFREAVLLAPKLAEAHSNLGVALQENGDLAEAIKEHRLAIDLKKNEPGMHLNLGNALAASGRPDEAIAVLDKAVKTFPESPDVPNGLAWHLATCADAKFRDPARAVTLAAKAVELASANPFPNHWGTLGTARYRVGDWNGCIKALDKRIKLNNGGDAYSWFFLAMARWQLGEKELARKSFERAVQWMDKNAPQNEELRRFRAEAEELLGVKRQEPKNKKKD
jgi:tetratricopeptide (TPR) repeat protein